MSKYCAKCKMNFTDSFDKCVYCGSLLLNGTIESDESNVHVEETNILNMTDEEILKKYQAYKSNIEEQTGKKLSDKEFINGLKNAKIDSLIIESNNINKNEEKIEKNNSVICPYCKSINTRKITTTSKVVHTAFFGIFSMSRNSKNFHCNQCNADF